MNNQTNSSTSLVNPPERWRSTLSELSLGEVLSTRKLLVGVFFLLIFTVAARPITDPDFWWHLKAGQYLLETKTIPHTDLFSVFRFGSEWVTHEWLAEAFIYSIFRSLGYTGLIAIFSGLITASFLISFRSFRSRAGHPYILGFALLVGAFSTLPVWGVRPQIFSLLFASIFLVFLDNFARKGETRKLWWLVLLIICWVNLHAGFALGLGLIGLTIVGVALDGLLTGRETLAQISRRIRTPLAVLLACLGALLVNPNTVRIYSYPLETLRSQAMMRYISEWWSPDFHEPMFQPLALLLLSTFAVLALSEKRVSIREILLFSATCLAALRSARNIPFFALVAMPLLAEHSWLWVKHQSWAAFLTTPEKRETGTSALLKGMLNVILLIAIPLGLVLTRLANSVASQSRVTAQTYPVAAIDFLSTKRLPQPIFNEYGWGGYIIWRLSPEYRVYIDGRADVYGDSFLEEFLSVHDGAPNWRESLERKGIRTVLIEPDTTLATLLRSETGWQKIFEDPQAVIFVRK